MSVDPATGQYHYDMGVALADQSCIYQGFQAFFQGVLPLIKDRL